ncbi:MAG: hypothetical protein GY816_13010, partial [Cytophagales bacterium]|nr:hypothetical protein [Cytophagales bacterium]
DMEKITLKNSLVRASYANSGDSKKRKIYLDILIEAYPNDRGNAKYKGMPNNEQLKEEMQKGYIVPSDETNLHFDFHKY